MAFQSRAISSFTAGELSPYVDSRNQLEKYQNGCRTLENFLPTVMGPSVKRPGTQYIGTAKTSTTKFRLLALNFSDNNKFQAELGVGYIRFWTGGVTPAPYTYTSTATWTSWTLPFFNSYQGDGTTTTFAINPGYNINSIIALVNGVAAAFTLGTNTVIFSSAPALGTYITITGNDVVSFSNGDSVEAVPVDYQGNYIYGGTPVPYQESELDGVNFITVGNVAYLTHPNHFPLRISFYGQGNSESFPPFTVGEVPWKWPATLAQNTSNVTITTAASIGSVFTRIPLLSNTRVICTISGTTATITQAGYAYLASQPGVTTATGDTWIMASDTPQQNSAIGSFQITVTGSGSTKQIKYTVPAGTVSPVGNLTFIQYVGASTSGVAAGSEVFVIATQNIFSQNHVNSYWEIDHTRSVAGIFFPLGTTSAAASTTPSYSIKCFGAWRFSTWGNWTGLISLQQSPDNINWKTIRTYYSNTDNGAGNALGGKNFVDTGDTGGTLLFFRIAVSNSTVSESSSPYCSFTPDSAVLKGWVKLAVVDGTGFFAQATVGADLGTGTATTQWYEGAFSAVQGYPQAVGLHESRVVFGGTALLPDGVWGSAVNDFQNFLQGALDSNSFLFNLASPTSGRVQWMISQGALTIGTTQDEWLLTSSSTSNAALTPSNVMATKQSHYGSASVAASLINDTIIYFQKMARRIREFSYNWQIVKWISNDISALSEQATRSTITERSFQRVPDATLWMTRGDGQLVSMLYEKEQGIIAFARHLTSGTFESVSVLPGSNAEDEVWFAVNRTINGSTARYIERLALGQRDALDAGTKSAWGYLDCSKLITQAASNTITGLSHLEAQMVTVWGSSSTEGWANVGDFTVSSGAITVPYPLTNALVGLKYTATLSPMRIVVDLQDGSSLGRKQSINEVNIELYQSLGGKVSGGDTAYDIPIRSMADPMDASPPAYTGWKRIPFTSSIDDFADIIVTHSLPMPIAVVAIAAAWDMSDQN